MITTMQERSFDPTTSAVGAARRFVAAVAPDDATADRLALVASELATNAVLHAGTPFTVRVVATDAQLRVAVRDGDGRLPTVQDADIEAPSGRGLAIVAALSLCWGVDAETDGSGKWVWAELPLDGSAPSDADRDGGATSDV